jgi:hypothetical protein
MPRRRSAIARPQVCSLPAFAGQVLRACHFPFSRFFAFRFVFAASGSLCSLVAWLFKNLCSILCPLCLLAASIRSFHLQPSILHPLWLRLSEARRGYLAQSRFTLHAATLQRFNALTLQPDHANCEIWISPELRPRHFARLSARLFSWEGR